MKLYDGVPRERDDVLQSLYRTYFRGLPAQLRERSTKNSIGFEKLEKGITDEQLGQRLFQLEPLCRIPVAERDAIRQQPQMRCRRTTLLIDTFATTESTS
ncbi:MAG: hypothetical protein U5R48_04290 [Gammaproteobacteria bacterium]|nr:hypothetical protein [Gammaproteobacteria bacterium]